MEPVRPEPLLWSGPAGLRRDCVWQGGGRRSLSEELCLLRGVTQSSGDADRQDPVGCPGAAAGMGTPGTGRSFKGLRFAGGRGLWEDPGHCVWGRVRRGEAWLAARQRPSCWSEEPGLGKRGERHASPGATRWEDHCLQEGRSELGIPELWVAERHSNSRQTAEQWTWAGRGPGRGHRIHKGHQSWKVGRLGGGRCPEKGYPFVTRPCPTLATPRTVACQTPLSTSFPRQENWSGSYHFLLQIKAGGKVWLNVRQVTWTRCRHEDLGERPSWSQ